MSVLLLCQLPSITCIDEKYQGLVIDALPVTQAHTRMHPVDKVILTN